MTAEPYIHETFIVQSIDIYFDRLKLSAWILHLLLKLSIRKVKEGQFEGINSALWVPSLVILQLVEENNFLA